METPNDIAASIRALRNINIEECATLVRAVSAKLNQQQKRYTVKQSGTVSCVMADAVEMLDACSDGLDEMAFIQEFA